MKSFTESAPRILIADDQADVLEALRLLLKGEGYQIESATSPAGIVSALEARDFDVVIMDLNYTRDTTSGQEGLGERGPGGGGHAARRARLHPEALGKRAPAEHHQDPDRSEQRHPARPAP